MVVLILVSCSRYAEPSYSDTGQERGLPLSLGQSGRQEGPVVASSQSCLHPRNSARCRQWSCQWLFPYTNFHAKRRVPDYCGQPSRTSNGSEHHDCWTHRLQTAGKPFFSISLGWVFCAVHNSQHFVRIRTEIFIFAYFNGFYSKVFLRYILYYVIVWISLLCL